MANLAAKVFRQAALDRISSPEQLDRMVTLTRPVGWVALVGAVALIAVAVGWGIVGTVPTDVAGDGIIIGSGGQVLDAVAVAGGRLASIGVHVGDEVTRGQVVATLDQTDTERALHDAQAVQAERKEDDRRLASDLANERTVKERSFAGQEAALRQVIAAANQRASFLKETIASLTELAKQGVVPPLRVEDARKDAASVEQQISQSNADLAKVGADRQALAVDQERRRADSAQKVAEVERQANGLAASLARNAQVLSPVDGKVTEIKVSQGAVVPLGGSVLSVDTAGAGLQLIAYIPPDKGKLIQPGMAVRIEPSTAKREEYGTMTGKIVDISEFPATVDGMRSVLQNDRLVTQFSQQGPPYTAHVTLDVDSGTPSGYRWSSGTGPKIRLGSGTLAKVEVTVREQAPITLVIPTIRKTTGIEQ